jgi:PAS domain S-box-containing protein
MIDQQASDAAITLDRSGRYVDANAAALALLGVSLDELRGSAPDRFSMVPTVDADQAAARAHLESSSSPLVGTTGLRRADGTTVRVAYAIESAETGYLARLWVIGGSPHEPATIHTADEVLRNWRAAERALAQLAPGTREWARTLSEIEVFRNEYQELFRAVDPSPETP